MADNLDRMRDQMKKLQSRAAAEQGKPASPQEKARASVFAALRALAKEQLGDESVVYEGTRIVLPEMLRGGDGLLQAAKMLVQLFIAEEEPFVFSREFAYRPYDGAAAFQRAMMGIFGTAGIGKATYSMFGKEPPEMKTISIGPNETMQVPWGKVEFPPLEATFTLGGKMTEEDGPVFVLAVEAPRKNRAILDGFFEVVAQELFERSIYRGQAIDGGEDPGFVDLSKTDPAKVVYAAEAELQLNASLWSVLEHSQEMRDAGMSLKRAVLLFGQYGTGKTLTGNLTGQKATANRWTYIRVRPGDDPYAAFRTAKLYAPAVVFVEDIDIFMAGKDREEIARLLDALDNVQDKGAEVVGVFTTNFPKVIEKGVLRPGRIDAVIEIDALDPDGYERLVKVVLPAGSLVANIKWDEVAKAYGPQGTEGEDGFSPGFVPAFAVEAAQRAWRYAMLRSNGTGSRLRMRGAGNKITTEDLVFAASGLRPQLRMLVEAEETAHDRMTLDRLFGDKVAEVVSRMVVDPGDHDWAVKVEKKS